MHLITKCIAYAENTAPDAQLSTREASADKETKMSSEPSAAPAAVEFSDDSTASSVSNPSAVKNEGEAQGPRLCMEQALAYLNEAASQEEYRAPEEQAWSQTECHMNVRPIRAVNLTKVARSFGGVSNGAGRDMSRDSSSNM
jgi:hypothetical protein